MDKQAAARCWRDGQKKRCFTYRFLATGTVEEKIFQRQLAKEGLQSVVDDKEQVNALSTKDLRNLFKLRSDTPSDTHDKLKCERCKIIHDDAEQQERNILPKKLEACLSLVNEMTKHEDAQYFLNPLNPEDHKVTKEHYEKKVKQPIDLGTIQKRLLVPQDQSGKGIQAYKSVSNVSKDVNRIFSNVMKIWSPEEDPIADAAARLHSWWIGKWQELVPILMTMKCEPDDPDQVHCQEISTCPMESSAHLGNERSDDYQEQIGMPDEENMRCWSHHYKTDTVDDPIFRAAMRGYDSVSFVFGLEVTWSKIQQRQQEEEDLKAMKELEEMEELQTLQVADDKGDQVTLELESCKDDTDEIVDDSMGVNETGLISAESREGSLIQDTKSGIGSPSICHSKDSGLGCERENPEAQVVASSLEAVYDYSKENQMHEHPSTPSLIWVCQRCTMENPSTKRRCEACRSNRTPSSSRSRSRQITEHN